MLSSNSSLNTLSIGDNRFGDEEIIALISKVDKNNGLEQINLEGKSLGPIGAAALGSSLHRFSRLFALTLSGNRRMGDDGVASFFTACASAAKEPLALRRLELCRLELSSNGLLKGLQFNGCAANSGSAFENIETLDLSCNTLGVGAQCDAFEALLVSMPALQDIELRDCGLGDAAASGLSSALRKGAGTKLRRLSLAANKISMAACKILGFGNDLANALSSCSAIKQETFAELNLRGNEGLGDDALAAIVKVFQARTATNFKLDIGETKVGVETIQQLAHTPSLVSLSLAGCRSVAILLPIFFQANNYPSIEYLSLSNCDLGEDDVAHVFEGLLTGALPLLACLEIGANPGVETNKSSGMPQQNLDGPLGNLVLKIKEQRPLVDIHWRIGDSPIKQ
eukprot:CAMPEP_0175069888 /NCGR_PEP_ID=MMETSP0052_2-20121109/18428_1 /TAXON_ID=51329 ORGANISM="Polytomella parva, Strain SAG 63-3" /NCGR_SAMPLE_ID=MMETSP0052_2 /ASSEMBLY_ACC=CAM_ASM_000194 /LENGTH=396 /DNA_ID=CAMNT_0016336979 /DNA_START=108 /DNA_END=1300 /DNA_ORIENTATION=+